MLNLKQFNFWYQIFKKDPELADEVLREHKRTIENMPTPKEAMEVLLADDANVPHGLVLPSQKDILVHNLWTLK